MNYRSSRLLRFAGISTLIGLSLVVGYVSLGNVLPAQEPLVGRLLSAIALACLATPLLGGGVWLWWRGYDAVGVWRVTGWSLVAMILITLLSLLVVYYQHVEGVRLSETWTIVTWVAGTGAVGGMLTGMYDLHRERARRDARTTAARLETIVETVPVPIMRQRSDGTVTDWNGAASTVFGWDKTEVEGGPIPFVPEDKRGEYEEHRRRLERGETLRGVETQRERKDGSRVDVQIWATPFIDHDRDFGEAIIALSDISELKDRERALRTLHRVGRDLVRARTVEEVFERATEGVGRLFEDPIAGCWQYDESTDRLEPVCQTDAATAVVGEQPTFEPGKSLAWEAFETNGIAVYDDVQGESNVHNPDSPVRSELILPLGEFGVMVVGKTEPGAFDDLDAEVGDSLAAAMETAIERAETEEHLRLFERAVEEAGHAIMITDAEGTIEYVNPAFETTTRYTRGEAIGQTPRLLQSGTHDESLYEDLWEAILSGKSWEGEFINQRKDGRLYRVEEVIAPIVDLEGTVTHFVGLQRDITERRLREQRLDVLNRILRHNIRNAMTVVEGQASHLRDVLEEADLQSAARTIERQASDLVVLSEKASVVERLFDRDAETEPTCEVRELLTECIPTLRAEYPNARIEWSAPEGVSVRATDQLQLAIREAVDNAVVHNDQPRPEVTVRVSRSEVDESDSWVEIEIADDGPGIPPGERSIIERGEETPLSHGTGIGLWLINWVVVSFGGEVTITGDGSERSTVTLRIPAA